MSRDNSKSPINNDSKSNSNLSFDKDYIRNQNNKASPITYSNTYNKSNNKNNDNKNRYNNYDDIDNERESRHYKK
jgi:hypothetical protein